MNSDPGSSHYEAGDDCDYGDENDKTTDLELEGCGLVFDFSFSG